MKKTITALNSNVAALDEVTKAEAANSSLKTIKEDAEVEENHRVEGIALKFGF